LHDEVTKLAAKSDAKLSLGFIVALGVALWSANAGMKAIIDALNVVYDEKEKRSFVRLNALSLLFTVVAILTLIVALAAIVVAPIVFAFVGLSSFSSSSAVAVANGVGCHRLGCDLSLWTKPSRGALAMVVSGECRGRDFMADQLGALLLVHRQFWRVQRDLRLAWRGGRHDDVDVDFRHCDLARGRA
jgi:Virulence factor BrkB